jgi:hypothetical protein
VSDEWEDRFDFMYNSGRPVSAGENCCKHKQVVLKYCHMLKSDYRWGLDW